MTVDTPQKRLAALFKALQLGTAMLEQADIGIFKSIESSTSSSDNNESRALDGPLVAQLYSSGILNDPSLPIDWDNPFVRNETASDAVTLDSENPMDEQIGLAFNAAGLNHKNPWHWRILLGMFAVAHFGPKRRRGARKLWAGDSYCQLLYDVEKVKAEHSWPSDRAACRVLAKRRVAYGEHGKQQTAETLRRAVREARDPDKNSFLALWVGENLRKMRSDHQKRNVPWTTETAAAAKQKCIELMCKWIANSWPAYKSNRGERNS